MALPECRAYERVSPAGPYSSEFNAVSANGNTVFFASSGGIEGLAPDFNNGNSAVRMFGATRGGQGWSLSFRASFPVEEGSIFHTYPFIGASANGTPMFVTAAHRESPENTQPENLAVNLYAVAGNDPPLLLSHDVGGDPLSGNSLRGLMGPVVASANGTSVAFSSGTPLTAAAAAAGGGPYVYEVDSAGNISLVSVKADGELPSPNGGAGLGSSSPGEQVGLGVITNAVSAEGTTVFFNSKEQYDLAAPSGLGTQLFMHHAGSTSDVSKGIESASFDGAATDGEAVAFTDGSQNIYEFAAATNRITLISSGVGGLNTFLTMSADGSHVYFASDQQLGPEVPPYAGEPFLYQWAAGRITYIATLSQRDLSRLTSVTTPRADVGGGPEGQRDATGAVALGPIRATTNGAHLAFESERRLTEDDHNEEAGRINVYEYNEGEGLVRVSQGETPGSGNGPYSATIGSWQERPDFAGRSGVEVPFTFGSSQTDGRVLSEAGAVFFSSREALVAGATNGALHLYEWTDGDTYLISPPGPEVTDAQYLENSPDGANVYFSTTQGVLPSDTNSGWVNIWDARVNGGFPGAPPSNPCAENECPVSVPPARFSGPGNLMPGAPAAIKRASDAAKPKTLTRAQKLATALKTCGKDKKRGARKQCEKAARSKYGTTTKKGARG
jgi:hypothetical protein